MVIGGEVYQFPHHMVLLLPTNEMTTLIITLMFPHHMVLLLQKLEEKVQWIMDYAFPHHMVLLIL